MTKQEKINRYAQIRIRLEKGRWSCDQELSRLQSEMQDLANELGLC